MLFFDSDNSKPEKKMSSADSDSSGDAVSESQSSDEFSDEDNVFKGELNESEEMEAESMSFLEHLEEFRGTVARSGLAFIIGLVVVLIFNRNIAEFLQMPLEHAYGSAELAKENLITYKAMGVISVFFQIALLGGLILAMPFMLYFLGNFIAPGLTPAESRVLRPSCVAAFLLFLAGVAFAFFVILPLTLKFTVRLNNYYDFDIFWAASDYYNMVVWFCLSVGAFFQFPLIVIVLIFLGVLTTDKLCSVRRGVFVSIMILAALLSPGGDLVSLPLTTGLMYGLFEISILCGRRIEKSKLNSAH